jgi:hypothetical protein
MMTPLQRGISFSDMSAPRLASSPVEKTVRDLIDWLTLVIKPIAMIIAAVAAFAASMTYQQDVRLRVLNERMKTLEDALTAAGDVVTADNQRSYNKAFDKFGVIIHGRVLTLIGHGSVPTAMANFWNDGWNARNAKPSAWKQDDGKLGNDLKDMSIEINSLLAPSKSSQPSFKIP